MQENLMKVTAQLELCQEESAKKDQLISQLTQQNHKLEEQIREIKGKNQTTTPQKTKTDPSLQTNVKVVISIKSAVGYAYDHTLSFEHPMNQGITDYVIEELKKNTGGGQCKYSDQDITRACAMYFANQKRDSQRKVNGTFNRHRSTCKSNNRKRKKHEERTQTLKDSRVSLTKEERQLGQQVVDLGIDGMSSDEDPCEDENDPSDLRKKRRGPDQKMWKVKEYPWRSTKMTTIIDKLDKEFIENVASPAMKRARWTVIRDSTCTVSDKKPPQNVQAWMLNLD